MEIFLRPGFMPQTGSDLIRWCLSLVTDIYGLMMVAVVKYYEDSWFDKAKFEVSPRNLSLQRSYLIVIELYLVVEYRSLLRFTTENITYLKELSVIKAARKFSQSLKYIEGIISSCQI